MGTNAPAKRIGELDFFRAIPLLGLPLVHVYETLQYWNYLTPAAANMELGLLLCCALGPSVFMIAMGINFALSRRTTPAKILQRGFILLAVGIGLNILRFAVPYLILDCFVPSSSSVSEGMNSFFASDILFFAGLAYILFALFKKLKLSPFTILAISIVMLAIDSIIVVPADDTIGNALLGHLIYVNDYSAFPLMSWTIFPAIGYMLAGPITKAQDAQERTVLYRRLAAIGGPCTLAMGLCLTTYGLDALLIAASPVNHYITDFCNVIMLVGLAFVWLWISNGIWKLITNEKLQNLIITYSKAILIFYCIQWIFVGWFGAVVEYFPPASSGLGFGYVLGWGTAILVVSFVLAVAIQKRREKK